MLWQYNQVNRIWIMVYRINIFMTSYWSKLNAFYHRLVLPIRMISHLMDVLILNNGNENIDNTIHIIHNDLSHSNKNMLNDWIKRYMLWTTSYYPMDVCLSNPNKGELYYLDDILLYTHRVSWIVLWNSSLLNCFKWIM